MAQDHSFTPSHATLVDRYLRAKTDDGNISISSDHATAASLFHDADVCAARPPDLVRNRTPARVPCRDAADGQQWFFFSPACFAGKSTTRRSRTVDGTGRKESWHSEASPKAVDGSEGGGGYVQMFSYHVRTATGGVQKPGWIMAEYSFKDTRPGDVVLCKVYKSPRGPGRSKASSSSSCTMSEKPGTKRKAADDAEHLEAATRPSTRPRQTEEDDDIMLFAQNIELDMLAAPEIGEMQSVEEAQPEMQQLAPATVDGRTDRPHSLSYQQEDAIQTVHGPLSEHGIIAALAAGVTLDELLLDSPSMPCPHPGGALGVLCT